MLPADLPIKDIALLVAGALLALLGGAIADQRKDRYRRKAKFEEACLAWLNAQGSILSRLKEIAKLAQQEPQSLAEHNALLARFQDISPELKSLNEALNAAVLYNSSFLKGRVLQWQSETHSFVYIALETIIAHHLVHIKAHRDQDRHKGYIENAKRVENDTGLAVVEKLRSEMENVTLDDEHNVAQCSKELAESASRLYRAIEEIERKSPRVRSMIASWWL